MFCELRRQNVFWPHAFLMEDGSDPPPPPGSHVSNRHSQVLPQYGGKSSFSIFFLLCSFFQRLNIVALIRHGCFIVMNRSLSKLTHGSSLPTVSSTVLGASGFVRRPSILVGLFPDAVCGMNKRAFFAWFSVSAKVASTSPDLRR